MPETAAQFGHFDADTFRAAQEEPTLLVDGRLFVGRLLGIEEWMQYADALDRLRGDPATTPRTYVAFYRRYLRAVFPRHWWEFGTPGPVRALFKLPWSAVMEAIDRFFVLQAQASTPTSASRSTPSIDSSPKTAPAPPEPAAMP